MMTVVAAAGLVPGCGFDGVGAPPGPPQPTPSTETTRPAAPGCDPESTLPAFDVVKELGSSVIDLAHGWKFALDPSETGLTSGFATNAYDDRAWQTIAAGRSWEEQGIAYDGVAWYRRTLTIPLSWSGGPIRLIAYGVDDEYDVFVNGALVKHHGGDGTTVHNRTTETDITSALAIGQTNVLAIRVRDWSGGGGITRKMILRHVLPLEPYRELLPEPVVGSRAELVDLYWRAWSIALSHVSFGTADNGLEPAYMDEGESEQIYQWDSSFLSLFGRYGVRLFPVMGGLDNFYDKQRPDGYIQRVYSETDGKELGAPTPEEPMVNPPLFAWVEHEYYRFTGDSSRLARVFPILTRYWHWVEANVRAPEGQGLYYQSHLGSGMDNTPRGDVDRAAWIDMSAQQALAARSLARIAEAMGNANEAASWTRAHEDLAAQIDKLLWNEADGFYYDLTRGGGHARVKHVGAFWTLLAGVARGDRVGRLVRHLEDPKEFARPHRFPSLAASEPGYVPSGHYWRGGVWAPANYMIAKGLDETGHDALARDAADNHLAAIASVLAAPPTNEMQIAPEERDGSYGTLWECYSPEDKAPGTRWDGTFLCRQDFVGWTGLGPIAMLFEDVIGLRVVGAERKVVWKVARVDAHGARRMPLGADHSFDLVARERKSASEKLVVDVRSDVGFKLEVQREGFESKSLDICPGQRTITVE